MDTAGSEGIGAVQRAGGWSLRGSSRSSADHGGDTEVGQSQEHEPASSRSHRRRFGQAAKVRPAGASRTPKEQRGWKFGTHNHCQPGTHGGKLASYVVTLNRATTIQTGVSYASSRRQIRAQILAVYVSRGDGDVPAMAAPWSLRSAWDGVGTDPALCRARLSWTT